MRKLELDLNDESAMADAIRQLDRDDALTLNKLIVAHIKNMRERSYSDHMERFSIGGQGHLHGQAGRAATRVGAETQPQNRRLDDR